MSRSLKVLIVASQAAEAETLLQPMRQNGYTTTSAWVPTPTILQTMLDTQAWDILFVTYPLLHFAAPMVAALYQERGIDLPVVVVVENEDEAILTAIRQAGATDYLLQGHFEALVSIIEHALYEVSVRRVRLQTETALRLANDQLANWGDALEHRNRTIELLGELGSQLQTCVTLEEAYTTIVQYAQRLFPDTCGGLYMFNAAQNLLEVGALWGEQAEQYSELVFAPDECWALRRKRPHLVESPNINTACPHVNWVDAEHLPAGYLCVPLLEQGNPLGLLHIRPTQPNPPSADAPALGLNPEATWALKGKYGLALTVAEYITLAVVNLQLRETIRNQTIRDPLTGLFNQHYLKETLERELRRAERTQRPLALILFDVDHFKRFNATFGYEMGNTYLQSLGQMLQTHVRAADIACRYRGDEFALVLPDAPPEAAQRRAEQLQEEIMHLSLQTADPALSTITVSMSVANFPVHGTTSSALLQAANDFLIRPVELPARLIVGPLSLNRHTFEAKVGANTVRLTPVEFELLAFLMSHVQQVFTAEQLLQAVWHYPPNTGSPELVRVHIKNLRNKIEQDPHHPTYLKTMGRFGYTIRIDH